MEKAHDAFGARATLETTGGRRPFTAWIVWKSPATARSRACRFPSKFLLEALLRNCDGTLVTEEDVISLAKWNAKSPAAREVPFKPARVILQDFTGVPAVVDLAAMRAAMKRLGGDPTKINPLVPVDLVIDHSVQVDFFGNSSALERNAEIEFRAQPRALRIPALGPAGLPEFPRGASGHGHCPPGEFGIPGQSGSGAEDPRRNRAAS